MVSGELPQIQQILQDADDGGREVISNRATASNKQTIEVYRPEKEGADAPGEGGVQQENAADTGGEPAGEAATEGHVGGHSGDDKAAGRAAETAGGAAETAGGAAAENGAAKRNTNSFIGASSTSIHRMW